MREGVLHIWPACASLSPCFRSWIPLFVIFASASSANIIMHCVFLLIEYCHLVISVVLGLS